MPALEASDNLTGADIDQLWADIFHDHLLDLGGESIYPRVTNYSNSTATTNQVLRLNGFKCKRTEPVGRIAFTAGTTPAGASPTLLRYGLYHRELDQLTYTLVSSTPHDATLLSVANTKYPKLTSAPYTKIRGDEYCAAFLVVSAAAFPTFQAPFTPTLPVNATPLNQTPIRCGAIAGQTDLPASFLISSVTASGLLALCEILP